MLFEYYIFEGQNQDPIIKEFLQRFAQAIRGSKPPAEPKKGSFPSDVIKPDTNLDPKAEAAQQAKQKVASATKQYVNLLQQTKDQLIKTKQFKPFQLVTLDTWIRNFSNPEVMNRLVDSLQNTGYPKYGQ
jgi:hypothetical protein